MRFRGRVSAHTFVDWLWNHITSGALVLIIISFLFTIAVYKINANGISKLNKTNAGLCQIINQSNRGQSVTRQRIDLFAKRYDRAARVERQTAKAIDATDLPGSHSISRGLIGIAQIDEQSAAQFRAQKEAIHPIHLPGC